MILISLIILYVGKRRRLTFFECSNDLNCMIDLAKVADMVGANVI